MIAKHSTWLKHFCAVLSQRLSEMDRQYSQGRQAFDSLSEEFYGKRPADEQRFYRHATLLTTIDPRSADGLLQCAGAAQYLAALEASQLPLVRRVASGYQLHGYFREFLTERLIESEGQERPRQLHGELAARYQALGNWPAAGLTSASSG